jgi:predicted kinase
VSQIVYISGRPGAGKSSLAFPLAAELGYSLVTKDLVKEALHDALYVPGEGKIDLAWSRRLTRVSFALLWTLAAHAGDMVIEANFQPHNDEALAQLRGLGGRTVEVHCACPAEVAHARYNARSRHEVHQGTLPLSAMDKYDRPVGIGPLITVDTTRPVDVAAVVAEVRRLQDPAYRPTHPPCAGEATVVGSSRCTSTYDGPEQAAGAVGRR